MVIMKKRHEQKWTLERILKAVEAPTVQKKEQPTVGDILVFVIDDGKMDEDLGPYIVEERRTLKATADFAPSFQGAGEGPMDAVADPERQADEALKPRDYPLVKDCDRFDEPREFT